MAALGKLLRTVEGPSLAFWCPGCDSAHHVRIAPNTSPWAWDGSVEAPTFTPSVLVTYDGWEPPVTPENHEQWKAAPWPQTKVHQVCHSFVRAGHIRFLADCTHRLADQTVPLPPWPYTAEPAE